MSDSKLQTDLLKVSEAVQGVHSKLWPEIQKQEAEIKSLGGTTTATSAKIAEIEGSLEAKEREYKDLVAELKARLDEVELKNNRLSGGNKPAFITNGSLAANSKEIKSIANKATREVSIFIRGLGAERKAKLEALEMKDIAGAGVLRSNFATDRQTSIISDPRNPWHMRDLLNVSKTNDSNINFMREELFLNTATVVPEGQLKPEAQFDFSDENSRMSTIAYWTSITRQLLSDVTELEAYIENRMYEGLKFVEDQQLLYGSGVGENILGLMNTEGIQNYAWSQGPSTDTQIDALRRALTLAQLAFYPVDGAVMNPIDWQNIELVKNSTNLYIWTNVATGNTPNLWRIPILVTPTIAVGDVLMGAFSLACQMYEREEAALRASDSDQDDFIRNRVKLLIEERIGLVCYRPKSLIRVTLDNHS